MFYMRNEIKASIVWAALAIAPLSGLKANDFVEGNNGRWLWNKIKSELYLDLKEDNISTITLQWAKEYGEIVPIDSKIIIDAALSYFDEEVKLYSLKWEARENVKLILKNYLSSHPILKKNSNWEVVFIIDNKREFASMIKELANTLFDGMPKVIRSIAILIAFGWNEELQKTLDNLDASLMKLPSKQYKDIVFDYFWWIIKRVCNSVWWMMVVGDYYNKVHTYYPNKNHMQIVKEMDAAAQTDNDIKSLKYPFKK